MIFTLTLSRRDKRATPVSTNTQLPPIAEDARMYRCGCESLSTATVTEIDGVMALNTRCGRGPHPQLFPISS